MNQQIYAVWHGLIKSVMQNGFLAVDRGLTMRFCGAVRLAFCLTISSAVGGCGWALPTHEPVVARSSTE